MLWSIIIQKILAYLSGKIFELQVCYHIADASIHIIQLKRNKKSKENNSNALKVKNYSNCWKLLKIAELQRKDETSLGVNVAKAEKICCMA